MLLHGVPSDVKVSSVIDEADSEDSQREQVAVSARAVPWKFESDQRQREASFDGSSSKRKLSSDASRGHEAQVISNEYV